MVATRHGVTARSGGGAPPALDQRALAEHRARPELAERRCP